MDVLEVECSKSPGEFARALANLLCYFRTGWDPVRLEGGLDERWQIDPGDVWRMSVLGPGYYRVASRKSRPVAARNLAIILRMTENATVAYTQELDPQ
jgi:hypothetical protein